MKQVRGNPESGLAAAGTAYNEDIFVPGRLGVFGPAGHSEAFRLGQDDVEIGRAHV